ncbi:MAG: phosphoribosylanthranilate isomerase [Methanobacteriaceae archaeon]|jgi:phosphoribosylanthranilate isomerase|nr:phosphoribosylanthranilate isomerase [Candidatus Methanorudis spinitermitis]
MKNNKSKIKIKICGLRREEDVAIVNKYKPDLIGFVFAESKRRINFNQAIKLKKNLNKDILVVGVFVDAKIQDITCLIEKKIIDIVQVHGNEDEEYIANLKEFDESIKIIKAILVKSKDDIKRWENSQVDYILLDSGKGSGKTFNWDLIGNIKKPFFIAGGINSENVDEVAKFNPFGIDLSSGAEENGFKSSKKIAKIMASLK